MKALLVFSGGLDSMMASQLIKAQGIDVQALFFETPFFRSPKAVRSAKSIDLPIKVVDITESHLEVVKNPAHGYGGNMNPCIDCHALMLRRAGEMLDQEGASFIISGEVLGQRPMSQNRKALSVVASESGYNGLILRPLSARLLPMTIPEEKGWVKDGLMDLSGRSRKPQMALAKKFGIKEYPSPAGGCLLTEPVFSRRLKDLLLSKPAPEIREIELLKVGRHFRIGPKTKVIVGRNQAENQVIDSLTGREDLVLVTTAFPGPTVLVTGEASQDPVTLAAVITVSYSDSKTADITEVSVSGKGGEEKLRVRGENKEVLKRYMI